MLRKRTLIALPAALLVFAVASPLLVTDVSAGFPSLKIFDQTGCRLCCPACNHVCHLDVEVVDAEQECFDVETKVICIPRVVFPWQKKKACSDCDQCDGQGCTACIHNGARTRRIRVLTTKKYKCPECEYSWSAQPCAGGCDDGCDSWCDETPYTAAPMTYRELGQTNRAPTSAQPSSTITNPQALLPVFRLPAAK